MYVGSNIEEVSPPDENQPEELGPENLHTQNGTAAFSNLILPAAPPMYRPFTVLDAQAESKEKEKPSSRKQSISKAGKYVFTSTHVV